MTVWVFVVYALATVRVVGLITTDAVTAPIRLALFRRLGDDRIGHFVGYLFSCVWCVSIWVGFISAGTAVMFGTNRLLLIAALALAFSQLTGMLAMVGRER